MTREHHQHAGRTVSIQQLAGQQSVLEPVTEFRQLIILLIWYQNKEYVIDPTTA